MDKIFPIILAGGAGTRLWPLSRKSFPKQFVCLSNRESFFQQAVKRVATREFRSPTVLTSELYRFIVREQLYETGITAETILIEPEVKNTAPAILAAAIQVEAVSPGATMLVMPSDHDIPEPHLFQIAVRSGLPAVEAGNLVAFGARPESPETGFGYLELAVPPNSDPVPLTGFIEKPGPDRAQSMINSGRYLWNMGIFMFSTRSIIAAFNEHCSDLCAGVRAAVEGAGQDLDFVRLAAEPWSNLQCISIDYAVMEKADNLSAVPYPGKWSDLGNWASVFSASKTNEGEEDLTKGQTLALECEDVMLRSETTGQVVVGVGLKNVAAVAMSDAVLIADLNHAHTVKTAVEELSARGVVQAEEFPRSHRPWGWFESLVMGDRFQVKRIVVNPGEALSLQSHVHRAEHWIVVEGTARVTIDDNVTLVGENQSVYIPLGAKHRLENAGIVQMVLIEVQTGSYFGEDDIIRYDDRYSRN